MPYGLFLVFFVVCVLLSPSSGACGETQSLTVTVYNQDRALVGEVRKMNIPKGTSVVEFGDVAETIEASSLQVKSRTSPGEFRVLDQNYEFDLINTENILHRYVGKRLKVLIPNPNSPGDSKIIRDATLLADNQTPIFRLESSPESSSSGTSGEIYAGRYDAVIFPDLPAGLRPQPTLVWLVDNRGPEDQTVEVSYLASKMDWSADYVLKLDRESKTASLSGWVTLTNQSGKSFHNCKVKLVAGDIHKAERPVRVLKKATRASGMGHLGAPEMDQEDLFEYHLYSLSREVDLADKQTKQVALLQSPRIDIEKRLVGKWTTNAYDSASREIIKEKPEVFLKFKNSEPNGLGIPLPKGVVRAYQESSDGSIIFVGEDNINHTPKETDIEIKMGESFDIVVERRLTSFSKMGDKGAKYGWEMRIKNGKDIAQRVELDEILPGEWRITKSDAKYEKVDARRIRYTVDAPPSSKGSDAVINYEAEVTW